MSTTIRRRRFAAGVVSALGTLAVWQRSDAAIFELKAGTNGQLTHPLNVYMVQMWEAIAKETNGRIRVQQFPNSELGSPEAMLSQLRIGALDIEQIAPSTLSAVVPATDISSIAFAFRNEDQAIRVAGSGPLAEYLRKEVIAKGIYKMRAAWSAGMSDVTSSRGPIRTPEDLRGFKIRVSPSKILVNMYKALGASAVSLSNRDAYPALQTKLVDGAQFSLGGIAENNLYEVQKYLSLTNTTWSGIYMIVNGDLWNKLPRDIQEIFERNNTKFGTLQQGAMKATDVALKSKLARLGMQVNAVDNAPFVAALHNYYQEWAKTFGSVAWGMLEAGLGHSLA